MVSDRANPGAEGHGRSERRFRKLVEFSSDIITLLDASGSVLYSTQSLKPTLGYEQGEMLGRSVFELLHPEDRPAAERLFRGVVQDPSMVARAPLRARHKEGGWRDLEVVATNQLDNPDIGAVVVNYRDVTERNRAEEQLHRTTDFLREAQACARVGSWEWDVREDAISWSDETCRLFGLVPTQQVLTIEQYLARIHPDDRDRLAITVREALASGGRFEVDHRVVHPDGSVHFLHGRGGTVLDGAGRALRMTGTVLDITARKQAEDASREANEHLRTLIDHSPQAIISLDEHGIVRTWNIGAQRLFGWTAQEAVGSFLPIVPDDKQDEFAEFRRRVMGGESLSGLELMPRKKDGSAATVNVFAAPLHGAAGRVTGVLALIEDVTGMKRLQQQFFPAQKMEAVGRLAAGVAHDFNNLLTAIIASTELLLGTLSLGHPGREDAEETRKAALRAADLIRQLLAFSRQQVMAPRVLSLNDVVTDMEGMLRRLIREDIDLRTVLADDLGAVRADPGQLEQVIMNLGVNARDAMPNGGKLTIETANVSIDDAYVETHPVVIPGPYVMLVVSDTGKGMNEVTKARIFEPFFTTKAKGQGTGLGLATVYGIVKQSGGYIWVYSEPDRGASFKVYLPRVDAKVEAAETGAAKLDLLRGSETILLCEDQPEVRSLTRRVLGAQGYDVLVAGDGQEALLLADARTGPIHLLVTDVVMPGMTGPDVARQLATARPTMKVLYLSGYADESIVRHGVLDSGVAFLQKPFTTELLARKVREVLNA